MSKADRQTAFIKFHRSNPDVWRHFRDLTQKLIKRGHNKFSQRMIWEAMRMDYMLKTDGDKFKLSNNHLPFYAKLYLMKYPEHGNVFELRQKKSPAVVRIPNSA